MMSLQRSPWGQKRRASYQAEAEYARTFEELLGLHRIFWWHVNLPMRSKAGHPDYEVWGDGWHAWIELKARNPLTGRIGKLSAEQRTFHEEIKRGAGEVVTFLLPDAWDEIDQWLIGHTGIEIRGWGARQHTGNGL